MLPSFSQTSGTQSAPAVSGTSDMEVRFKQLIYVDTQRGILGGYLLTYSAPTGSPGLSSPGPSYAVNPLLNIALNANRNVGVSVALPVTSASTSEAMKSARIWTFSPQAVPYWRSPGGTLLAVVVQYAFSSNETALTLNFAQLLSRNLQVQGTYGGVNSGIEYVNPTEDIAHVTGTSYPRSFTVGLSYMVGRSELPPR